MKKAAVLMSGFLAMASLSFAQVGSGTAPAGSGSGSGTGTTTAPSTVPGGTANPNGTVNGSPSTGTYTSPAQSGQTTNPSSQGTYNSPTQNGLGTGSSRSSKSGAGSSNYNSSPSRKGSSSNSSNGMNGNTGTSPSTPNNSGSSTGSGSTGTGNGSGSGSGGSSRINQINTSNNVTGSKAGNTSDEMSVEYRAKQYTAALKQTLRLNDEQAKRLEEINADFIKRVDDLSETSADKRTFQQGLKQADNARVDQFKAVLSSQQLKTYQNNPRLSGLLANN